MPVGHTMLFTRLSGRLWRGLSRCLIPPPNSPLPSKAAGAVASGAGASGRARSVLAGLSRARPREGKHNWQDL